MPSSPQLSLMTQILNLEGVYVLNYSIIENIGIFVSVEEENKDAICPNCQRVTRKIHKNIDATIQDISMGNQDVFLKVNRPQMRCKHCNHKFTKTLSFADKGAHYTKRFGEKIIKEVLNSDIRNTAKNNNISEQQIETMLKHLYEEVRQEKPQGLRKLGIDEIAFVKGQKNYCVVLVNLETGKIVGMVEKRTEEVLSDYLKTWGSEVLKGIEEVSIDLWRPYKNIANKLMEQAEVVADRFHVMKQINDELDKDRRKIKRENIKKKNKKNKKIIEVLKKAKYALLKNSEDLNEEQKLKIQEIQKNLPELYAKYQGKEKLRMIFEKPLNWANGLFEICEWLRDFKLLFPNSYGTIRRWIGEIIAYFDNRTTQGMVEGINNKLKLIKRRGFGFRNFSNFRMICYLNSHAN
jgi:transposase